MIGSTKSIGQHCFANYLVDLYFPGDWHGTSNCIIRGNLCFFEPKRECKDGFDWHHQKIEPDIWIAISESGDYTIYGHAKREKSKAQTYSL